MELKATFPKRRDGGFGSVTVIENNKRVAVAIGADGTVEVDDKHAPSLIDTGNFVSADGSQPAAPGPMLIGNDEEVIDLMEMDKPALLEIAKEMGLDVTARNSAHTLRDAIQNHLSN